MKQIILILLIFISLSKEKPDNLAKTNQEVENFVIAKMDELRNNFVQHTLYEVIRIPYTHSGMRSEPVLQP